MLAELDRLIRLQQLDTFAEDARRRIEDQPGLVAALDARLTSATEALERARANTTSCQAARRAIEKDLAMVQSRLEKYKDQLMAVKTNKEFQAMQKEIASAENDVRRHEDRILERMLEADTLAAQVKEAEARLRADQEAVAADRRALEAEMAKLKEDLDAAIASRARFVADLPPDQVSVYETVRSKRGVAVVEMRGGYCSACHVRLRPQVANRLRLNDSIYQCDSCQRILYFVQPAPDPADALTPETDK